MTVLTRRAVLAGAAALPVLAAGCKNAGALAAPPRPAAAVAVLRAAIIAEERMTARYQTAIGAGVPTDRAGGPLVALLVALLGEHQAHLVQLRERLDVPAGSPYPPVPGQLPAARQQLAGQQLPGKQLPGQQLPGQPGRLLLANLAAAEHQAAGRLASQLLTAPPSLAQLFASISAAEAAHVQFLVLAQPR